MSRLDVYLSGAVAFSRRDPMSRRYFARIQGEHQRIGAGIAHSDRSTGYLDGVSAREVVGDRASLGEERHFPGPGLLADLVLEASPDRARRIERKGASPEHSDVAWLRLAIGGRLASSGSDRDGETERAPDATGYHPTMPRHR